MQKATEKHFCPSVTVGGFFLSRSCKHSKCSFLKISEIDSTQTQYVCSATMYLSSDRTINNSCHYSVPLYKKKKEDIARYSTAIVTVLSMDVQLIYCQETKTSQKHLLTLFRSANHSRRTGGGALCTGADGLCTGADGPRAGAGRSAAWCEAAVLSGRTRTVRGTGPDGPRPGAGARIPCLTAGRSAL
jgi:hypothetical protein